ncbi:hypothetical protein ACFVMC_01550 [Nocardia sp. NPDC127579]|uniref:hypothetical protein n=1 Tax=Nocardia sp. NPDC127579 TaxID=3345402 RepID=UPI003630E97D
MTEISGGNHPLDALINEYDGGFVCYFRDQYIAEGDVPSRALIRAMGRVKEIALGLAEATSIVLDARGFTVTDEIRDRITGCKDLDQLERWLRSALDVGRIDELFADSALIKR